MHNITIMWCFLPPVLGECDVNFCMNNATCTREGPSYSCKCLPEFQGSLCEDEGILCIVVYTY